MKVLYDNERYKMKKTKRILAAALSVLFAGCSMDMQSPSGAGGGQNPGGSGGNTSYTSSITSVDTSRVVSASDDFTTQIFSNEISLNLSEMSFTGADFENEPISESKTEITDGISVKSEIMSDSSIYITLAFSESSGSAKITVSGTLEKGTLEIATNKNTLQDVALVLDGASITSGNYPALLVSKSSRCFLNLSGENNLTDGRSYGTGYSEKNGSEYYDENASESDVESDASETQVWEEGSDKKGTLFSKGAMLISGNGSLSVTTSYKHGIYSGDYIRIFEGNISVENSGRNCIRAQNAFVMDDGSLNLNGTGTHTNDESRGIIVEGSEENPGEGFIYITGGTINCRTTGKAISAKWDIDEDAETSSTDDDPNPVVVIRGGTLDITTTASVIDSDRNPETVTYYDSDGVSVTETRSCSPEGIEGKSGIIISGGTLVINSTDDPLNASLSGSGFVNISGGEIYLCTSSGDAVDSNGDINISGGTIIAIATMGSEDGFDCDGALTFTGGLAVGISGSSHYCASSSNAANTQNTFVIGKSYTGTGGTSMAIKDSSGECVFAFEIPSAATSFSLMTISSPELKSGESYSVFKNVSLSGGTDFMGLYTNLPSVSGGSSTTTISTSSGTTVYTAGVSSSFQPR